jgi:hypothetical protein
MRVVLSSERQQRDFLTKGTDLKYSFIRLCLSAFNGELSRGAREAS